MAGTANEEGGVTMQGSTASLTLSQWMRLSLILYVVYSPSPTRLSQMDSTITAPCFRQTKFNSYRGVANFGANHTRALFGFHACAVKKGVSLSDWFTQKWYHYTLASVAKGSVHHVESWLQRSPSLDFTAERISNPTSQLVIWVVQASSR